jgi:hypothetical protein
MVTMTGVVEQVSSKDVTTKWGVKPTFSIKVNGQWIKTGFKSPGVVSGDEVSFDAETTTYGIETKVVNKIAGGGSSPVKAFVDPHPGKVPSVVPAYSKVFPIPPLHGDRSIVRQNALNRATDVYIAQHGGKPFTFDDMDVAEVKAEFDNKEVA